MQDLANGIYPPDQLPNTSYHAMRHIPGSSTLKLLATKSPAHYKYGKFTESPALAQGSGIHAAVLEPHDFDNQIACGPDDRRGNKWKDALAANEGKIVLPKGDYDKCLHIRDAVWANGHIASLLGQNDRMVEYSGFGEVSGVQCKVRPDMALPSQNMIIDLKSAADASHDGFGKAVFNFGYHLQAHMYPRVWEKAGGFRPDRFVFLAVEKEPPYACALYELDEEAKARGKADFEKALRIWQVCTANNEWPGYPDEVQLIKLPNWMKGRS